jgi:hypothetical protein
VTKRRRDDVRRSVAAVADQPNILVRNFDGVRVESSKVALSSGILPAAALPTRAGPYKRFAYLPAQPWRPAPIGVEGLGCAKPRLGFFRVPDEHLARLRELAELPPSFTQQQARIAAQPLESYLSDRFGATEPLIVHGLNYAPGGLETVTVNPLTNKFIGLHIDSWDGKTYEERRAARTRISVNVGRVSRYLLVLNLAFDQGAQLIQQAFDLLATPTPHRVLPTLFWLFPELSVLRIEIGPGEAYVADTDNLIHDASTFLSSEFAFHCTFRAYWNAL